MAEQFDKTFNAKIYIGFNEQEKSAIMKEVAERHYQTLYIYSDDIPQNPVASSLPNVRIEDHYNCTNLDRETDIREKAFNKCCVIIDEVLNPNGSYEVVFNRMSYYVKSCDECIIFQYSPCIESINDFLLLAIQEHTKYGKKAKGIDRELTQDIIDELVLKDCIIVKPDTFFHITFRDITLPQSDLDNYKTERDALFNELKANQDAVKVYNNLNKSVAVMKSKSMGYKQSLFRAKTGGRTTYKDVTSIPIPVCEFPLKPKSVFDYMYLNDLKGMEFWISNTKVDQYNKRLYTDIFNDCNTIISMIKVATELKK